MTTYTQVYKGQVYEFDTEDEMFRLTRQLDVEFISYSIQIGNTYKVTIL